MKNRIAVLAFLFCAVVLSYWTGMLRPFDEWIRDNRFQFGDSPVSGEIVMLDIDAVSIDRLGGWPWKRSVYGQVVERLNELGASVIAFDVDFSSPSDPDEDVAFAAAMAESDAEIYLATFNQPTNAGSDALHGNQPIGLFADVSRLATVNVFADRDAVVRAFPYGAMVAGAPVQSIAAVMANYSGLLEGHFYIDFGIRIDRIDRISVIDLLTGAVPRTRVEGKRIIVGANAAELRDFFTVPRYGIISGHTLQAAATETLLQNRAIQISAGLVVLAVMFAAAGFALWARKRDAVFRTQVTLLLGLASLESAATVLQVYTGFSLQTAGPHLVILCFGMFFVVQEIDLKRILLMISESRAENTQAILDRVIADNSDGIVVLAEDVTVYTINKSAEQFFRKIVHDGATLPPALTGVPFAEIAPERLVHAVHDKISAVQDERSVTLEPELIDKDYGDLGRRVLEYTITPSVLDGGVDLNGKRQPPRIFACVNFRDVTERQIREERASFLARFDQVTRLPNTNSFLEFLNGIGEGKVPITDFTAICRISISRLQIIQDTMGQDFSDELLNQIANRLADLLRPEEYLAATNDSGFHLFLIAATKAQLEQRISDLLDNMTKPYFYDGHGATVGADAGIALLDDLDRPPEDYVKQAKSALSQALMEDGNAFAVYEPELDLRIQVRQQLELDLWRAFEEKQFVNFYQPQINLADGSLYGAEALIRWIHPERGFVSPAEFIPIAEQSSLIVEMGEWAMNQACLDATSWPGGAKIAVNLSPVQFFQGDLVQTVENALTQSGLSKDRLDLEITESLFMEDTGRILDLMSTLRGMGLRFALDDFGTGYSSLAYIQNFPLDKIKIDQAFVRGMQEGSSSISIVRAVADLARALNMETVAEGVETDVERRLVSQVGCSVGQGYLFSKPLPAEDMMKFAESMSQTRKTDALN